MQALNILILGSGKSADFIKKSKYIKKLYTTSQNQIPGALNINFNTFQELARKCKGLQIDFIIVEENKWIYEGVADVMRMNHINCFAPGAKWSDLALYNAYSRELLEKYEINIPPQIKLPVEFPVVVKADGITRRADSLQEVIDIKNSITDVSQEIAKTIYIEKFLEGETYTVTSLYDGKNILTFPDENVEEQLLTEYSKKLENMLNKENADFIGFINSKLILSEGKLYNTGFSFNFSIPETECDLIYIMLQAIYQKLDEVIISELMQKSM